ncbi:hypothetical protein KPB04_25240 [Burkholderia cenocepacia]|uniref:hypothetical protein n=1 Tax=Burkholderia cenocepacia TaxID=95486 RepID=UPI0028606725|nr:hypothetical protein [Burkholderia cenocepacia]MDR8105035.1 hypothetical protein [Burkholderia cenocepacia]
MAEQTLNAKQVASMLVSTSCGVGFLLGTGELALRHGMAACLYAVATAFGLIVLGSCAPHLWAGRKTVWSRMQELYGHSLGHSVALLSLVWMTGVLAAQIRGGSAVLALAGFPPASAMLLVVSFLLALSLVSLAGLSACFAVCIIACNVLLVRSLVVAGGLSVWIRAPASFVDAIHHSAPSHTGFVFLSVAAMVIGGADYQQFALAARGPSEARMGCFLAAVVVFTVGFLPASAVIAAGVTQGWLMTGDSVQAVPALLIHSLARGAHPVVRDVVVVALVTTALGSASAILRAMSEATASLSRISFFRPMWSRALPLLFGLLVASRPESLVDMMVDLNTVYIAAIGPLLALTLLRVRVPDAAAKAAMGTACILSLGSYLVRWTAAISLPESAPLIVSFLAGLAVALVYRPRALPLSSNARLSNTAPGGTSSLAHPSAASSSSPADDAGGG